MSTKHAEHKVTSKSAEADHLVAAEPKVTALSCDQLCGELASDLDILDNLSDFPANRRAAIRAAILRSLAAIRLQMHSEHCPACD